MLCVPLSMVIALRPDVVINAGTIVWSTDVPLPTILTAKRLFPGRIRQGVKARAFELRVASASIREITQCLVSRKGVACAFRLNATIITH